MNNLNYIPIDILVVEDNPGDARLIMEALKGHLVYQSIQIVKDGEEAMNFLHNKGKFTLTPRPDLIFLDLNLPKKNGRDVLAEIKSDENLKQIPVVILTSSQQDKDILDTYSLHANCFITKPIDFDQFIQIIESIENFWFSMVKLPPKNYGSMSG